MNALTIDLVPKGKISFEQSETGIEILFGEEEKEGAIRMKTLGSIKGDSLLFLNTFFSSCITIAVEKSRPPEPNWLEFLPIFEKLVNAMGKMEKDEDQEE